MSLKFNLDRPKVSEDEINKQKDFKKLVEKFKQQSVKQAQGDESWWNNRVVRYSTVIAGVTVVCTITYFSLFNKEPQNKIVANDKINTQKNSNQKQQQGAEFATNSSVKRNFISAPSRKLSTPYSTYKINNATGGKITHATSTKISVPKNTFVDKQGKSVVGDVTIEFKEFHDVGDVIANGIPMAYDSAGVKYNLETAGMFDIRGTQNGEPVFIAPSKNIDVALASTNKENRFNQYILDTIAKNWKYTGKDKAVPAANLVKATPQPVKPNNKLDNLKREIDVIIPKKIDSVKTIYTSKVAKLPTPKAPAKPLKSTPGRETFKLDGSYEEFPELAAFNNVIFEVGPENNNYSKDLHDITWSDVKVSQGPAKGTNYLLTLKYRSRTEKLIVYPIFSGVDLEKANAAFEDKLDDYEKLAAKKREEEARLLAEMQKKQSVYLAEQQRKQKEYDDERAKLNAQADVQAQKALNQDFNTLTLQVKATRLFRVSSFGIYNSDCPHSVPKGTSIKPIFVLGEKENPVYPSNVYLIDHTHKTVFALDASSGYRTQLDAETDYSFCLFLNNEILICNKEQFKGNQANKQNKFIVSPIKEGADNLGDFKKSLEI